MLDDMICSKVCIYSHSSLCHIHAYAVVASLLKESLTTKNVYYHPPTISFKRILFQQLNKPWTVVNRCAGILAQHGKADYAEALISKCLGYCVHSPACTRVCNATIQTYYPMHACTMSTVLC